MLAEAIEQGGTTLNDFADGEGNSGYFQVSLDVYGREGEPCPAGCGGEDPPRDVCRIAAPTTVRAARGSGAGLRPAGSSAAFGGSGSEDPRTQLYVSGQKCGISHTDRTQNTILSGAPNFT